MGLSSCLAQLPAHCWLGAKRNAASLILRLSGSCLCTSSLAELSARVLCISYTAAIFCGEGSPTLTTLRILFDALGCMERWFGIPGAVIGGAIASVFYTRKYKLNFAEWAILPRQPCARQVIGRFGKFLQFRTLRRAYFPAMETLHELYTVYRF